jgi:hypothetical protein
VAALSTMLGLSQQCIWRSQQCWDAPNNVFIVPTLLGPISAPASGPRKASSPEDVETLPARARRGSQVIYRPFTAPPEGPGRRDVSAGAAAPGPIIPNPWRGDSGTLVPGAGDNGERREAASPRHRSTPFESLSPLLRRPAVPRLRTVAWAGWERLYILRERPASGVAGARFGAGGSRAETEHRIAASNLLHADVVSVLSEGGEIARV